MALGKVDPDRASLLPTHNAPVTKKEEDATTKASALMSLVMYSSCSIGMVLANKAISMSLDEAVRPRIPAVACVMYQAIVAVVLVEGAKMMRWVEYSAFQVDIAKKWLPCNILFVSMLCTGFMALRFVSVPMVTIFKNMSNLITVTGDYLIFGQPISWLTIISVLIMVLGAVMSAFNDIEFDSYGYFWMVANCICTASYSLYMRYATTNVILSKWGMVFYNNLLSILLLLPLSLFLGEFVALSDPEIMTPWFIFCNTLAGFLGFYLNFAVVWAISATSATTYAIVGSLNKIPLAIFGAMMFGTVITQEGMIFIAMGILGGLLYAYSKLVEKGAFGR